MRSRSRIWVAPYGTAKIGRFEYDVDVNDSARTVAELNDIPLKVVGDSTIYLKDVAYVADGFAPQNKRRAPGRPARNVGDHL